MKKIFSVVFIAMLMLVSENVLASAPKKYEVPVEVMHYSIQGKKSMADQSIDRKAVVIEEGNEYKYFIVFKPMDFMNTKGNITNLFALDGDNRTESKVEKDGGNNRFTIVRSKEKEQKIEIAIWVDAMDVITGGGPGSGEQKAILKFDWTNAKELTSKVETKTEKKVSPNDIKIMVNAKEVTMEVKPYIENGRTMVPVRFISEALGLKVDWKADTKTVVVGENVGKIELQIGKVEIKKSDGSILKLDSPAVIKDSRTFVPLRAIAEISGAKVDWKADTRTIKIEKIEE
ncbi:MAG: copper amine oxidase N-terminal domain-containing protein [Peptoniphilaceae bacterium]